MSDTIFMILVFLGVVFFWGDPDLLDAIINYLNEGAVCE